MFERFRPIFRSGAVGSDGVGVHFCGYSETLRQGDRVLAYFSDFEGLY